MDQFRSPLLKQMPHPFDPWVIARVTARLIGVAVILALGLLVGLFYWIQPLSKQSVLGRGLYWLHDALWLPLVGILYTLPFPISLAILGMLVLALVLFLASFVLDGLPLRVAHLALTRAAIYRPVFHPILQAAARSLQRFGLPPGWLTMVVASERTICAAQISEDAADQRKLIGDYLALSQLYIELTLRRGAADHVTAALLALEIWQETDLTLQPCLTRPQAPVQIGAGFNRRLESLVAALGPAPGADLDLFAPVRLARELLDYVQRRALTTEQPNRSHLMGDLIVKAETRRQQLEAVRRIIERHARLGAPHPAPESTRQLSELMLPVKSGHLVVAGRLAEGLAAGLGEFTGLSEVGVSWLEAVETLHLGLGLLTQEEQTAMGAGLPAYGKLVESLPTPLHYALVRRATARSLAARRVEWVGSESAVWADDFVLAARPGVALAWAALDQLDLPGEGD